MARHKDNLALAAEFMKALEIPVSQGFFDKETRNLGVRRIYSAWMKFDEALGYLNMFEEQDPKADRFIYQAIREMADLAYGLYQLSVHIGLDLDSAVRALHKSHMSKLGKDGKPVRDENGKIIKGPKYKQPDFTDVVRSLPVSL